MRTKGTDFHPYVAPTYEILRLLYVVHCTPSLGYKSPLMEIEVSNKRKGLKCAAIRLITSPPRSPASHTIQPSGRSTFLCVYHVVHNTAYSREF